MHMTPAFPSHKRAVGFPCCRALAVAHGDVEELFCANRTRMEAHSKAVEPVVCFHCERDQPDDMLPFKLLIFE